MVATLRQSKQWPRLALGRVPRLALPYDFLGQFLDLRRDRA